MTMKTLKLYQIAGSLLAVPVLLILQTSKLFSQGEAQSDEEEIVVLSEFVVDAKSDSGYLAARAIAGLKTNTPIMELPINLKVLNPGVSRRHELVAGAGCPALCQQRGGWRESKRLR